MENTSIDTNNSLINTFTERMVKEIDALPRIGITGALKIGDVIGALRREADHERYQRPIRSFYDLSTAHVSPDARHWLEANAYANALQTPGTRAWAVAAFMHGWVMRVPTESGLAAEDVPFDLRDVCIEAMLCGCQYIMFDADAEIIGTLPVYHDDETSTEGFSDEEKAALEAAKPSLAEEFFPGAGSITDPKEFKRMQAAYAKPAEIIRESLARTDAKVIHPEDGMPMETDAYGGDIDTFLQSYPDTTVQVKGMAVLTAKRISLLLKRHGVDMGLINILMHRLREAAETRLSWIRKRDAIAELQTACVDILMEVDSEIKQRKTGGNDEDWKALEAMSTRLTNAVRALV